MDRVNMESVHGLHKAERRMQELLLRAYGEASAGDGLLMSEEIVCAPGPGIAASPHFLSLKAVETNQNVYCARAI